MAGKSNIEWTDASWTPIRARNLKTGKIGWHCEHSTTACEFCYAEGMNKRLGTGLPFKPGHRKDIELFLDEDMLLAPLRWKKPRMIFVCSMTDLFADFVSDEWIDRVFAVMALAPQHTFQVLTKRAERMRDYVVSVTKHTEPLTRFAVEAVDWVCTSGRRKAGQVKSDAVCDLIAGTRWPLPNVWLGVSCERQQEADERIPLLLQTPAAVRFISAEPLLGPIDLRSLDCGGGITWNALGRQKGGEIGCLDWVIVGGESGSNARPMHPDWARSLHRQCATAGVPFFFKQWGAWFPWLDFNDNLNVRDDEPEQSRFDAVIWQEEANRWDQHNGCWDDDPGAGSPDDPDQIMGRVGKKAAGRLLDGREHNEMPSLPSALAGTQNNSQTRVRSLTSANPGHTKGKAGRAGGDRARGPSKVLR